MVMFSKTSLMVALWIVFSMFHLQAQFAIIDFTESSFDFGQIKEEKGIVSHEFTFTNNGSAPLSIIDVKASCGCTTPFYTKDFVAPGKKGVIKVQYDPFNRPGPFDKTLSIMANTDPAMSFLKIKGFVVAKVRTIEDDFPDTLGNLRMASRFMNMGSINNKEINTKEFEVYNEGSSLLSIHAPLGLPSHLKIDFLPKALPPKTKGKIIVSYDPKLKNDFGYLFDNFIVPTSDKKSPRKEISVVAVVSEDFSGLTPEQKSLAPTIILNYKMKDFGDIQSGDIVPIEFQISNTGKSDLMIRKIKSTCKCISIQADLTIVIKPNESILVKASLDTQGRKGQEQKNIYIYSNDYKNPELTIDIKANIIQP
ncbi:MAG: DUF1573 domain-containing protein [Cytophagales bacterium]|nr:MAG: DUF1573 domain-containing protein [Cytophagales bacterium]